MSEYDPFYDPFEGEGEYDPVDDPYSAEYIPEEQFTAPMGIEERGVNELNLIMNKMKNDAMDLIAPTQHRLAMDVFRVHDRYSSQFTRAQINELPIDYRGMASAFPNRQYPRTVGQAFDYLTRSMYPAFAELAYRTAQRGSGGPQVFMDTFQNAALGFAEEVISGQYLKPGGQEFPFMGIRSGFYAQKTASRVDNMPVTPYYSNTAPMFNSQGQYLGLNYQYAGGNRFFNRDIRPLDLVGGPKVWNPHAFTPSRPGTAPSLGAYVYPNKYNWRAEQFGGNIRPSGWMWGDKSPRPAQLQLPAWAGIGQELPRLAVGPRWNLFKSGDDMEAIGSGGMFDPNYYSYNTEVARKSGGMVTPWKRGYTSLAGMGMLPSEYEFPPQRRPYPGMNPQPHHVFTGSTDPDPTWMWERFGFPRKSPPPYYAQQDYGILGQSEQSYRTQRLQVAEYGGLSDWSLTPHYVKSRTTRYGLSDPSMLSDVDYGMSPDVAMYKAYTGMTTGTGNRAYQAALMSHLMVKGNMPENSWKEWFVPRTKSLIERYDRSLWGIGQARSKILSEHRVGGITDYQLEGQLRAIDRVRAIITGKKELQQSYLSGEPFAIAKKATKVQESFPTTGYDFAKKDWVANEIPLGTALAAQDLERRGVGLARSVRGRSGHVPINEEQIPIENEMRDIESGLHRPPVTAAGSGGAGDAGQPPYNVGSPDFELPEDYWVKRGFTPRPEVVELMGKEGNAILNAPTGWGKTEILVGQAAKGGLSILTSPFSALNEQLQTRLRQSEVSGFYLPGWPGEGAPQSELDAYEAAHKDFYDYLGIEPKGRGWSFKFDPNTKETTGAIDVDPATGRMKWKEGYAPATATMSFEKFAMLRQSRLGRILSTLSNEGLLNFVGIDEAHQLFGASRELGRYIPETLDEMFPGKRTILTSGSLTSRQINVLQGEYDVADENVYKIRRDPATQAKLRWRFDQPTEGWTNRAMAFGKGGPGIVFSGHIGEQEELMAELREGGYSPFRFHRDPNRPLSEVESRASLEKLTKTGLQPGEVGVLSSAGSTGLDRPEVASVAAKNPYGVENLIQEAGRLRAADDVRTFTMAATPESYERRFESIQATQEYLSSNANLANIYTRLRSASSEFHPNWKIAGQQQQQFVGDILESEGLHRYSASNVISYLREAGLIQIDDVVDDEGHAYRGWSFTDQSTTSEIAARMEHLTAKSRFQTEGGRLQKVPLSERAREDIEWAYREQGAMKKLTMMAAALTTSGLPGADFEAGELIRQGADVWQAESGGGLAGFEQYVETHAPQQLAQRYEQAVLKAAEAYEAEAGTSKTVNEAKETYAKATTQAANAYLGGSPTAATFATEQGQAAYRAGLTMAGTTMMAHGVGYGGTAPPPAGGGPPISPVGPLGSQPSQPQPSGSMWKRMLGGQQLYSYYIASRFWRMIGEPAFRDAQYYEGIESVGAPASYYGQAGMMDLYGTPGGAPAMNQLAQYQWGRAASPITTPLARLSYNISRNQGLATAIQGARIAGGALVTGGILAHGMPFMGIAGMGGAGLALGLVGGGLAGAYALAGYSQLANAPFGYERGTDEFESYIQNRNTIASNFLTGLGHGAFPGTMGISPWTGPTSRNVSSDEAGQLFEDVFGKGPTVEDIKRDEMITGIVESSGFTLTPDEANKLIYATQSTLGMRIRKGTSEYNRMIALAKKAKTEGIDPSQLMSSGLSYAENIGMTPGTPGAFDEAYNYASADPSTRFTMASTASRQAGFASQLAPYIGGQRAGLEMVKQLGIRSQEQLTPYMTGIQSAASLGIDLQQILGFQMDKMVTDPRTGVTRPEPALMKRSDQLIRMLSAYTAPQVRRGTVLASTAGRYGEIDMNQYAALMATGAGLTDFATDQISAFSDLFARAGVDVGQGMSSLANLGMAPNDLALLQAGVVGGDMQALSWLSNQYGIPDFAFYDRSGNPILQTSGSGFEALIQGQARFGNQAAQGLAGHEFFGYDPALRQAFLEGGTRGVQLEFNNKMYGYQMAGIGIQMQQLALRENLYWGSGSWQNPAPNSLWGLQDQLRQLGYNATMGDFAAQAQRMQMSNQFAIQQEAIQQQRLDINVGRFDVSRDYGRWQRGFQAQGMALQRQWTREDWERQDQLRGLQFGWELEDINEAIRLSSGRERQRLVRQRDRLVTTENLETEGIDEQRSRQEELWKREEERFDKQVEHQEKMFEFSEDLLRLDQESYDLNKTRREEFYELDVKEHERKKEEFQERYKLEQKIEQLQREYQYESIQLQKAALGVQAAAAAEQKKFNDELLLANQGFSDMAGEFENMRKFDPIAALKAMTTLARAANNVSIAKINALVRLLNTVRSGTGRVGGDEP